MEITTSCQSLSFAKLPRPLLSYYNDSFCPSKATLFTPNSVHVSGFNCLTGKLQYRIDSRRLRKFGVIHSSAANSSSDTVVEKWVLNPIGDGDTRHIGFKTGMPNAFEIASNAVTVGRTPEGADVVIPIPTVSRVHARIQKTEESLLITDLDSTNGTFIDEKRLRPGVAASALPGSKITFGDTHLALFSVSKLTVAEKEVEESETAAKKEVEESETEAKKEVEESETEAEREEEANNSN